jgi:hypothetical protein
MEEERFFCGYRIMNINKRGQNKQMCTLSRPKPTAHADKTAPNNAKSLRNTIILGLNDGHNKLRYAILHVGLFSPVDELQINFHFMNIHLS